MFWSKKDNEQKNEPDYDEYVEAVSDEENNSLFEDEEGIDDEDAKEDTEEICVTEIPADFDALCSFVNAKPVGYIQYMRKSNKEVFELREAHLRIAGIWGSVSMAREYSGKDYARIMLALELLEAPEKFYVIPMFSDSEIKEAITGFCLKNFGDSGKKYAKNPAKFAKFVASNDCADTWKEYTDTLMHTKLAEFCSENGIAFGEDKNDD